MKMSNVWCNWIIRIWFYEGENVKLCYESILCIGKGLTMGAL
jgi:hypothetical protein